MHTAPLSKRIAFAAFIALGIGAAQSALGSSHREAPLITEYPKVDGTDFYMFTSYEAGREDFVTIIANFFPLQDAYGGPNYFSMDPEARYDIQIDNNGDALRDMMFRFRFKNTLQNFALDVGAPGATKSVPVPLINIGGIAAGDISNLNFRETFTVDFIRGHRQNLNPRKVKNAADQSTVFEKPVDNIGNKSIPDYEAYAAQFIYNINVPGCETAGRMFVGQRQEPFAVNLGETFDLINLNPLGPPNAEVNTIADKNITSLILELPKVCLVREGGSTVIGAWSTASLPETAVRRKRPNFKKAEISSGEFIQMSRLAMPLVNEVVIGLKDKNKFNASQPKDDAQFLDYVTHPTLPELIEILFPAVEAPNLFPRTDLVAIFLTGVAGLNQTATACEMMRLNTATAPLAAAAQNPLGVIGGDNAGYPNGRRPGDDVVDISLRAVMGVLLDPADAPSGNLAYTDGVAINALDFEEVFPYLNTPLPGSPN